MVTVTVVPDPEREGTAIVPPTSSARSIMRSAAAGCRPPGGRAGAGRCGIRAHLDHGQPPEVRLPDGRVVIVPLHKSVARGTRSSILRQAGLTTAQVIELLS